MTINKEGHKEDPRYRKQPIRKRRWETRRAKASYRSRMRETIKGKIIGFYEMVAETLATADEKQGKAS